MNHYIPVTSNIYSIVSNLKLLDTKVGPHEETVDFDAKHSAKRTRNSIISSKEWHFTPIVKRIENRGLQ